MTRIYKDVDYYSTRHKATEYAAKKVLGLLGDIVNNASVVDLGCGVGTWASVAKESGASSVHGIDGPWIERQLLQIDQSEFAECDLETEVPDLGASFDVAFWLENIEHLSKERGEILLTWLTDRSEVIVFSGAIPGQGGRGHINEQWQSHWATKFSANGFEVFDHIRPQIWADNNIPYWYRQNILLFVKPGSNTRFMRGGPVASDLRRLDVVHPEIWTRQINRVPGVRTSMRSLIKSIEARVWRSQ